MNVDPTKNHFSLSYIHIHLVLFFSDGLDLSEQVFKGEIRSAKDMENLTHSQGALNYEMILRPDKSNIATFGTSKLNLSCFLCCFYMSTFLKGKRRQKSTYYVLEELNEVFLNTPYKNLLP